MRRYIVFFMILLLFSLGINVSQADAYSVKVEKDSMYADVMPSGIMKNVAAVFQKQVRKSMKYYDKYKDADNYTYISRIPEEYRDFINVAKEIKDSDEIVIRYPFYIYYPDGADYLYDYYFIAEKNQERLCLFNIGVYDEEGKIEFRYDKMLDSYFSQHQDIIAEETLFYYVDESIYAETPEKVIPIRELDTTRGAQMMEGSEVDDTESRKFYQKGYEEKKKVIMSHLEKIRKGKGKLNFDENMESELEQEDEPLNTTDLLDFSSGEDVTEEEEESDGRIYLAVCAAVFCILVIVTVLYIRKQRQE